MIDKIKEYIFDKSVYRFIIVGCFCTLLDFSIYMMISDRVGINIGKGISMGCSMVVNYCLNKFWSFSDRSMPNATEIPKYIATQIINMAVNISANSFIFAALEYKIVAFICATAIAMVVNYLLQRNWVFAHRKVE